jgi:hypothetical protein
MDRVILPEIVVKVVKVEEVAEMVVVDIKEVVVITEMVVKDLVAVVKEEIGTVFKFLF